MTNSLSIRSYTSISRSHEHSYHQIVLPLHGYIDIEVNGLKGIVGVGQTVIIQKGTAHEFKAHEQSRFLVADLEELPENARQLSSPFATISSAMHAFCSFAEIQLQHHLDVEVESTMVKLFKDLLSAQKFSAKIDSRITKVMAYVNNDLGRTYTLKELASAANLSVSHFKVEFRRQTGKTMGEYLTEQRMDKARALLRHTDIPVQLVAEKVGYASQSAFSRRFSSFFGEVPRRYQART